MEQLFYALLAFTIDDTKLLSMIVPLVVTLATVVAVLWKSFVSTHQRTVRKLDNSEKEHKETSDRLLDLTEKVGVLEGRQEGVERLSKSVLEEIRKLPCKAHHPACPEGCIDKDKKD